MNQIASTLSGLLPNPMFLSYRYAGAQSPNTEVLRNTAVPSSPTCVITSAKSSPPRATMITLKCPTKQSRKGKRRKRDAKNRLPKARPRARALHAYPCARASVVNRQRQRQGKARQGKAREGITRTGLALTRQRSTDYVPSRSVIGKLVA